MKISQLTQVASIGGDELVEVSKLSPTVTLSATDISAQASDNSFNHAAGAFITTGFAVGNSVRVQGFTGNTSNNIFSGVITALTASKMTIAGADGDVIVDDAAGETVTISKWETRRSTISQIAAAASGGKMLPLACSDESTALGVGTKVTFHMPYAMTINEVFAGLTTPQAGGSALTVDVKRNGTSLFSTKITVDNTEETSLSAAVPPVLVTTSVSKGDKITVSIDQIGDGTAKGLKVYIIGV